jgi:hypothetical protein
MLRRHARQTGLAATGPILQAGEGVNGELLLHLIRDNYFG